MPRRDHVVSDYSLMPSLHSAGRLAPLAGWTKRGAKSHKINALIRRAWRAARGFSGRLSMKRALHCSVAAIAVAAFLAVTPARLSAQSVPVVATDIAGVVKSPHGAEAGVWVIAETHD